MVDVVRICRGHEWAYVPVDGVECRIARLASAGLADIDGAGVRLRTESGPVAWESLVGGEPALAGWFMAAEALRDGGVALSPNEIVAFGNREGCASYNPFADVHLSETALGEGLDIGGFGVEAGDIVLTVWPDERRVMPAMACAGGRGMYLELPDSVPHGHRCFVLDEEARFLTASMGSEGETVRILNPMAMLSWLMAAGSRACMGKSDRFVLGSVNGRSFIICDSKTGEHYGGKFGNDPAIDVDKWLDEKDRIEAALSMHGLGGILPTYELENR